MAKTARKAKIAKKWRNYGKNCNYGAAKRWHSSVRCPDNPLRGVINREANAAYRNVGKSSRKKRSGRKKCKKVCTSA